MQTISNIINWLNGKKTLIGAAIYGIGLILSQVVVNIWGYSPEWILNTIKTCEWAGGILAGLGVTHGVLKGKVFTKNITPLVIIVIAMSLTSCSINKQLENTMNYFQKHGSATYKKEPNGAITTNVTYKGFYDPTKVKQTFSKFIATYNATEPSINIVATTADTTLKLSVPAFKK